METYINKVILQGKVGATKGSIISNRKHKRFTLLTQEITKDSKGITTIMSTWHSCMAFESKDVTSEDIDRTAPQAYVRVEGKLSNNRYIGPDGNERTFTEINVEKLNIIQPDKE